ncbi:MAG: HAD family hydrolase [Nitrososphaerales archaeon]
MPASTYKAVLFDLDGTLIEFKFKVKESRQAILEMLGLKGHELSKSSTDGRTQTLIDEVEKSAGVDFSKLKLEIHRILDSFETAAFKEAKVHPGAIDTLRRISSSGILTAVVTNSGRAPVDGLLLHHGFLQYLELVVTRDEVERIKPSPDGILAALQKLEVEKKEALYVGDSVLDIEASRAAGVKCVSVASGLYDAKDLVKFRPDYLIHRIEELTNIVFNV